MEKPIYKHYWPEFCEAMLARLEHGHQIYGDESFEGKLTATLAEMEQECLDHCGWGFVLWVKLQQLKQKIRLLEDAVDHEVR